MSFRAGSLICFSREDWAYLSRRFRHHDSDWLRWAFCQNCVADRLGLEGIHPSGSSAATISFRFDRFVFVGHPSRKSEAQFFFLRPPFLPPLRELALLSFLPRPLPPFLPPPLDLLTVAQARRAASFRPTPAFRNPLQYVPLSVFVYSCIPICFRVP
jgi:hypothetical protein